MLSLYCTILCFELYFFSFFPDALLFLYVDAGFLWVPRRRRFCSGRLIVLEGWYISCYLCLIFSCFYGPWFCLKWRVQTAEQEEAVREQQVKYYSQEVETNRRSKVWNCYSRSSVSKNCAHTFMHCITHTFRKVEVCCLDIKTIRIM